MNMISKVIAALSADPENKENLALASELNAAKDFHKTKLHTFLTAEGESAVELTPEQKDIRKAEKMQAKATAILAKYATKSAE